MSKPHNHSFDYIGAAISDSAVDATKVAQKVFKGVKLEAIRTQNTPYYFSKGNIFEFISGAKMQVAAAEKGRFFRYDPVSAGRGHFQSPEDLRIFIPGPDRLVQAKVSDSTSFLIKQFSRTEYTGMDRITTTDMYGPVKRALEQKARNGTITPAERDALIHLKPGFYDPVSDTTVGVTQKELMSLKGTNGKVDLIKVDNYIKQQQNNAFMHECIQNTASVTLVSTISGCVISTVSNIYKYSKDEQDLQTAAKNIGIDTAKAAGHGLLSASIANGFKYIGFKTGNDFLHESVNSLVIANGVIDIGRAFYYLQKGDISNNDFIANVIGSTALTTINLGLNLVLDTHPFIKLVSTIVINQIGRSLIESNHLDTNKKEKGPIPPDFSEKIKEEMEAANKSLKIYLNNNQKVMDTVVKFVEENEEYNEEEFKSIFKDLNIGSDFMSFDEFADNLKNGKPIKMKIKAKK